jgi:pyruvate dehydrogenase E1 component alpha subunit
MAVVSKRSRSDAPTGGDNLDEAALRGMYRAMLLTRALEERGQTLYRQGRIPGSFYTGRGNEAAAVGVAWAMAAQDVGCPTQRDLGVHVVRGMAPWRIIAQYSAARADRRAGEMATSTSATSRSAR